MKPPRARPGRFSLLDIRDVEHLIVHGEFHLVAGEGEAVDPLRVLLVPGPGIQGQHLPQSIPPVRGEPLQQSGGNSTCSVGRAGSLAKPPSASGWQSPYGR